MKSFFKTKIIIEMSNFLNNLLERFFVLIKESDVQIVSIQNIQRKCIKIEVEDDTYLTYCVDLEEHD